MFLRLWGGGPGFDSSYKMHCLYTDLDYFQIYFAACKPYVASIFLFQWNTTSFSDLLVKYEGLLFKVVMRVRFQGSEITDSVLLKIEGKRKCKFEAK